MGKAREMLRIAAVGDIHCTRSAQGTLQPLFAEISASADVLLLCGDVTDYGLPEEAHVLARELTAARVPVLAVLGNHDYGMPACCEEAADRLAAGMRDLGIDVLRNQARSVAGLTVAGLDDYWGPYFAPRGVLASLDPGRANLVLCHNPDVADEPVWSGYRGWILCGHTHGGQCKPPFLPPPLLPVRNKRYTAGEIPLANGRCLYINRGLGHLIRVRFNVRPEITAFSLTADPSPLPGYSPDSGV